MLSSLFENIISGKIIAECWVRTETSFPLVQPSCSTSRRNCLEEKLASVLALDYDGLLAQMKSWGLDKRELLDNGFSDCSFLSGITDTCPIADSVDEVAMRSATDVADLMILRQQKEEWHTDHFDHHEQETRYEKPMKALIEKTKVSPEFLNALNSGYEFYYRSGRNEKKYGEIFDKKNDDKKKKSGKGKSKYYFNYT